MNSESKKGRPLLSLLLIVVMIAELGLAAFKYPGFLVRTPVDPKPTGSVVTQPTTTAQPATAAQETSAAQPTSATQETEATPGDSEDFKGAVAESEAWSLLAESDAWQELSRNNDGVLVNGLGLEITNDSSPGNPALIETVPDPAAIAAAEPVCLAVTPEAPSVSWNGITVDFGGCNLTEADILEIRDLGSADSAATESRLRMYDFSLASGKHEFAANVTITVPCESPGYDRSLVTFNEETRTWEPLPYRLSEDGACVTYTKTHFSTDAQMVFERVKLMAQEKFIVTDPLDVSDTEYHYQNLLNAARIDQSAIREFLEKDDRFVERFISADALKPDWFKESGYDGFSAIFGRTDVGIGSVNLLKNNAVPAGLATVITAVGIILTVGKVTWQVSQNKNKYAVLEDNMYDLISAGAGAVALATPGNPVTAAIAIAAFNLPTIVDAVKQIGLDTSFEYVLYRNYLNEGVPVTVGDKTFRLYPDGRGWDRAMSAVRLSVLRAGKDRNAVSYNFTYLYDEYLNSFFRKSPEEKERYAQDHKDLLIRSYGTNPATKETFPMIITYPDWKHWTDPDETTRQKWVSYHLESIRQTTKELVADQVRILLDECEMMIVREINNVILPYLNRTLEFCAYDPTVTKATTLVVKDTSFYGSIYAISAQLKKPSLHTAMMDSSISFADRTKELQFTLGGTTKWMYEKGLYPSSFRLFVTPKSNSLTKMRFYAYMMIGCPTSVTFNPAPSIWKPVTVAFTVPPDLTAAYTRITLTVNAQTPYQFWNTTLDVGEVFTEDLYKAEKLFLIDLLQHSTLSIAADGTFSLTFEQKGSHDYTREECARYLSQYMDENDWIKISIKYETAKPMVWSGTLGEDGKPGQLSVPDWTMTGTSEVWLHSEFDDEDTPPEELGVLFHSSVKASLTGQAEASSAFTELPGQEGKFEIIELTLSIHLLNNASADILHVSGVDDFEPEALNRQIDSETGTFTVRYISPKPVQGK
ncbi:MAG: hypothetical protein J5493_07900 [Lachnospiraceae bacterium]|nr:hypothetical protein [Lachnospiraceae bacterium]